MNTIIMNTLGSSMYKPTIPANTEDLLDDAMETHYYSGSEDPLREAVKNVWQWHINGMIIHSSLMGDCRLRDELHAQQAGYESHNDFLADDDIPF